MYHNVYDTGDSARPFIGIGHSTRKATDDFDKQLKSMERGHLFKRRIGVMKMKVPAHG